MRKAQEILAKNGNTCVICDGQTVYSSTQRGVKPLLQWLDSGTDVMGFSAADKVVGKAAAFLYCLLGVRQVYGAVMSVGAVKVLRAYGIEASWGNLVENIENRQKTGMCPMDWAMQTLSDPDEAVLVIREIVENQKNGASR